MKYFGEYTCWEDVLKDNNNANNNLPLDEPNVIFAFKNIEVIDSFFKQNKYVCYILDGKYYETGYNLHPYLTSKEELINNWNSYANTSTYPQCPLFIDLINSSTIYLLKINKPVIEI